MKPYCQEVTFAATHAKIVDKATTDKMKLLKLHSLA